MRQASGCSPAGIRWSGRASFERASTSRFNNDCATSSSCGRSMEGLKSDTYAGPGWGPVQRQLRSLGTASCIIYLAIRATIPNYHQAANIQPNTGSHIVRVCEVQNNGIAKILDNSRSFPQRKCRWPNRSFNQGSVFPRVVRTEEFADGRRERNPGSGKTDHHMASRPS